MSGEPAAPETLPEMLSHVDTETAEGRAFIEGVAFGQRFAATPAAPLYHGDGDQCLGAECMNIDEATGDHGTDVHSDDWWEGYTAAALSAVRTVKPGAATPAAPGEYRFTMWDDSTLVVTVDDEDPGDIGEPRHVDDYDAGLSYLSVRGAATPAVQLEAAMAFLRKRLVGTPPNVDMEDVWFASLLDEAEAVGRGAATPAAPEALRDIILNGGLRLPGFDHWRERVSAKPSDPDDIRWDCVCGYSGSPEKVQRHWAALSETSA